MAGGRLRIDYLVAGAVVKPFEVMDATSKGVLDASHGVPVYWYGKTKVASLFGSGPINGMDAHQTLAWIYRGGGLALYNELLGKINLDVVGFFAMPMPTQPLGWFKKPIKDAKELKGLKYRTVGLAADLFQEMGAKVTQLPGGEIMPALEKGVIDAFEFNNPTSDMRFGAQDVIKNYMMGSYHQAMEFFEIAFNKKKWATIPKDLQAILPVRRRGRELRQLVDRDGQLLARPAGAEGQAQGQRDPHAEVDHGRAAQGLGRPDQEAFGRGSVLRQGGRVAARVREARRLLHVRQRGGLQARLRARLQDQDPGLSRAHGNRRRLGRHLRVPPRFHFRIRAEPCQRLIYAIDQLNKTIGHAFAWCIIILTFGTCYEVFVRYVLDDPTSWAFDMSYLMYGAVFYMAGAYTLSRGGHVRADMFYRLWSERTQARGRAGAVRALLLSRHPRPGLRGLGLRHRVAAAARGERQQPGGRADLAAQDDDPDRRRR